MSEYKIHKIRTMFYQKTMNNSTVKMKRRVNKHSEWLNETEDFESEIYNTTFYLLFHIQSSRMLCISLFRSSSILMVEDSIMSIEFRLGKTLRVVSTEYSTYFFKKKFMNFSVELNVLSESAVLRNNHIIWNGADCSMVMYTGSVVIPNPLHKHLAPYSVSIIIFCFVNARKW